MNEIAWKPLVFFSINVYLFDGISEWQSDGKRQALRHGHDQHSNTNDQVVDKLAEVSQGEGLALKKKQFDKEMNKETTHLNGIVLDAESNDQNEHSAARNEWTWT